MEEKDKGNSKERETLKNFFGKGSLPKQKHFEKLIDSTFNKTENILDSNEENGLMVYPVNEGNLISFFNDKDNEGKKWYIHYSKEHKGLVLKEYFEPDQKPSANQSERIATLFGKKRGKVGIDTKDSHFTLGVEHKAAFHERSENIMGTMPADGKWHNVFENALSDGHAYEIMALAKGKPKEGKYCLLHAIAISTFGNSNPEISKTCAHYGQSMNKISIRWESRKNAVEQPEEEKWWHNLPFIRNRIKGKKNLSYNLQMKTISNYGSDSKISFRILTLWDESK